MQKEAITKYVKAAAGILACTGAIISPEMQAEIVAWFMGGYAGITAIQAWFKQKAGK